MADVIARIKAKGKDFEIMVDLDKALEFKKSNQGDVMDIMAVEQIFYDVKKGTKVSDSDLNEAFGTQDINIIGGKIIKQGELMLPLDYKRKEQEGKIKQIIDFLSKNALDPSTNMPHTATRIEEALKQAGANIDNRPVSEQLPKILEKLKRVIPLKIETKKLSLKIPPSYTGTVYGLVKQYKDKEEWLDDGSLVCMINLPVGVQMDFYDKLNAITHGSVVVEEIKE